MMVGLAACGGGQSGTGGGGPAQGSTGAAGSAGATGAGGGAAQAPAKPAALRDVRTSYASAVATFAPLWAAHEFGIFEQYGLRSSDPQLISGGPANAQALVARELDATYTAFSP